MGRLPREKFVVPALVGHAYEDSPMPLSQGQTISQPYIVAVMAQLLELTGVERVLEIGAGSGYGAAVLSLLAKEVVAVERIGELLAGAKERWKALGLTNIQGVEGDGTLGWPELAPFDAISVTAAAPNLPMPLFEQLHQSHGRMVIPMGPRWCQNLSLVRRKNSATPLVEKQFPCVFVPLLGEEGW
ncbi:MAG: protein-L-isoaspartate(D-aspartate) O-methyltransferase [Magnetococcales bacterium]|nr:protein-L-isoaspartate(D-aspartate) O-methyltransferase [Magnetococcales bacterium]